MSRDFRLAVGQSPAELDGSKERLDWLQSTLPQMAAEGTDLVLLPELFASGYNIGDKIRDRAEKRHGPTSDAVAQMARAHNVAIAYGYPERDGDNIFNAALCIGPEGVLGHHRKLAVPPGPEREYFSPGRGNVQFKYRGLTVAFLICYDVEFPETVRHIVGKGVDLVLVPTALGDQWGWVAQTMIPTRAYENGVYLAYANSAGVEDGFAFLGQSVIAAPDGVEVARAGPLPEIIYADLDRNRVTAAQARLPYLNDRHALQLD